MAALSIPIAYKVDNKSLKQAESGFKSFGHSIKGIMGGLAAGFAVRQLFDLGKESVKAAAEDLKSQRLLERQLKSTAHATKSQISTNEKWLGSLSMVVGIVDDKLRPALANAVRGTGSLAKGQKLLKIALDGAAATGKPLNTVLQALIKATNGQTTSLYRLAPELKKSKGGVDAFAASVKGAAALAADPFDRFKVATDELKEKFGKLLLPMVTQFVDYLTQKVVPAVSNFLDQVGNPKTDAGKMFKDIKDAVHTAFKDVQDFFALFGDGNAIKGFGNVVKALVNALPALVALKGILMLASAGTAISNLVRAVAVLTGAKGGPGGTGVPGILPTGNPASVSPRMIGPQLPTLSPLAVLGLGMMTAGGGGTKQFNLTDAQKNKFLNGKKIPTDLYNSLGFGAKATGPVGSGISTGKNVTIVVNSYGSTPDDFVRLVHKAFKKNGLINGGK